MSTKSPQEPGDLELESDLEPTTGEVVDQVCEELSLCGYRAVQYLTCECIGNVITISGKLPSFHQKQVAFSLVMKCLPSGMQFDDDIEIGHLR